MVARRSSSRPRTLLDYDAKRDFAVTSEPRGARARAASKGSRSFVVQKHDATRLHYDFRLEHDGVLWSWAVPKGPSLDPSVRRLAARTEDHPLEYASFEGVIPHGEYGGGPVIVWDRGTWTPEGDPSAGMEKGHLRFTLEGEKLKGAFHLVRTKAARGTKESWLLFKSKDEHARAGTEIVDEQPQSVSSGRTIESLTQGSPSSESPSKKSTSKKSPSKKSPSKRSVTRDAPTARTSGASDDAEATRAQTIADALAAMSLGFSITSPDKVLYPDDGVTKADVMGYLAWIAPRMLPFVKGRPLMLARCPEGLAGQCFYQKHAGTGVPEPIRSVAIPEKTKRGATLVIDDVAGLVALGQIGALEIHTWMCDAARPEAPNLLTLDLDPDASVAFDQVIETALALRRILEDLGLRAFVKTTGGKGLHVVAPVAEGHDWDTHETAAQAIVTHLARRAPARYLTVASKAQRRGKIFLDWLRNLRGSTAVAPYSLRSRPRAPIAMPLTWDELERGIDPSTYTLERFVAAGLPARDPWADWPDRAPALDRGRVARALQTSAA